MDELKERTVVFTAPKGSKLSPTDFLEVLAPVQGKVEAFGTAWLGSIWRCTLLSPTFVEAILGTFTIEGETGGGDQVFG